jgi:large subunit ribosomal protein L3
MQGLIGQKIGMTQVYDSDGRRIAVTVIEAGPCVVLQRKTRDRDGYDAVQLGYGAQKEQRVSKAARGHCGKVDAAPCRIVREFRLDNGDEVPEGQALTVAVFDGVTHVDVMGVTKGRGFQGVIKRHKMSGGRMTHGGHSRRRVGAIGQCSYPARVAKGQRMPGHMGHRKMTQQNLKVERVLGDRNLLLVRGAVPGPNGGFVMVRRAVKNTGGSGE